MLNFKYTILVLFILSVLSNKIDAQNDRFNDDCQLLLPSGFIIDGTEHSIIISNNRKGIVDIPFTGGYKYRVIVCANKEENLLLKLYDKDKTLLFTSNLFKKSTYYDFEFLTSIECEIEIEIVSDKEIKDDLNIVIGYKEL